MFFRYLKKTPLLAIMLLSLGFMMTAKADSGFSFLDPEFTLDPEFKNKPEKRPHLVAVLPFLNKTDNTEASTVVRRAIYNHFSSLGYIDTELTIIDAKLKQNYLLNNKLNQTPLKKLARILKVDDHGRSDLLFKIICLTCLICLSGGLTQIYSFV